MFVGEYVTKVLPVAMASARRILQVRAIGARLAACKHQQRSDEDLYEPLLWVHHRLKSGSSSLLAVTVMHIEIHVQKTHTQPMASALTAP